MCGIIGVVKRSGDAVNDAFAALARLEYRGYDSAGIAALDGGKISVYKKKGGVDSLKVGLCNLKGEIAMGHTRWATNGEPSDVNAHPHVAGKVAVVHNGIIENAAALSSKLAGEGRVFLSQTDSEVIAHLIDKFSSDEEITAAVAHAAGMLAGSFALCVMYGPFGGLIAVKYKSSQVIGFAPDAVYVASDIPALPQSVKQIYFPPDGSVTRISKEGVECFDFSLKPLPCVRRGICAGQWSADKCGYPHFMLKEIEESPRTVTDTAEGIIKSGCLERCSRLICGAREIIITGCGTAYNAGLASMRFFADYPAFCSARIASELRYFPPSVTRETLVVAVSQSGETADTVEAVGLLRSRGAKAIAVTNCGYSALTRSADAVVPVCAGAEICVAATKSYIGQIAALYMLAAGKRECDVAAKKLAAVSSDMLPALSCDASARRIAGMCAQSRAVFFLGRGSDYYTAVEASLKLKEVSYIFSDAYPAGELKHGTLALVDESTLAVFIICERTVAEKCVNALEQVLSRKGRAAVVTCFDDVASRLKSCAEVWLLPRSEPALTPLVCAVALQKVAYFTATGLGIDPDKPRNLAKSVTVE